MKTLYTLVGVTFLLFVVVTSYMILVQPLIDECKKSKEEKG
ncbi:hypothetical protein [Tenacibaculum sp.]